MCTTAQARRGLIARSICMLACASRHASGVSPTQKPKRPVFAGRACTHVWLRLTPRARHTAARNHTATHQTARLTPSRRSRNHARITRAPPSCPAPGAPPPSRAGRRALPSDWLRPRPPPTPCMRARTPPRATALHPSFPRHPPPLHPQLHPTTARAPRARERTRPASSHKRTPASWPPPFLVGGCAPARVLWSTPAAAARASHQPGPLPPNPRPARARPPAAPCE